MFFSVFTSLLLHTMHELSVRLTFENINTFTLNMTIYFVLSLPISFVDGCEPVHKWSVD